MTKSVHEFVGDATVQHLQQPAGTDLCFATMLTGYAGLGADQIARVHTQLVGGEVSDESGLTGFFAVKSTFEVDGGQVVLDPIATPFNGVEETDEVIHEIDQRHRIGSAVALLYNRSRQPGEISGHWIAISGHEMVNGVRRSYTLLDPVQQKAENAQATAVSNMVRRSVDSMGIFAYAMSRIGEAKP